MGWDGGPISRKKRYLTLQWPLSAIVVIRLCSLLRQSMYALMAKNEELAREMQPVNALHEQMYPFTLK